MKTSASVGCPINGVQRECLKQIDIEDLIEEIQKLVNFEKK